MKLTTILRRARLAKMLQKVKLSTYNDGIIRIYREKERYTDFSARRNVSTLEDMDFIAKLAFQEASKREQDLEFAEKQGFSLTMKVKTRLFKGADNKCKAVIGGFLYDISYIDKGRTEMWLFLEEVKKLDT